MVVLLAQSAASVPTVPGTPAPESVLTSCRTRSRQLYVVCGSAQPRSALSHEEISKSTRVQSETKSRVELQQVHTATGFPIALPRFARTGRPQASEVRQQILRQWASRQARQEMLTAQREKDAAAYPFSRRDHRDDDEKRLLEPVFRASPYAAEALRERRAAKTASILFLDEGNYCRSVLAEAVFKEISWGSVLEPFVRVESASIGPTSGPALHDARVMWAAQKAGLTLDSRSMHPFNEVEDIVNYDLILTMDHFDQDEVYREVAVFDAMNPGGGYSTRVRQLGSFAPAACKSSFFCEDISDPLYGNSGDAEERTALLAAVHQLRLSCRGLVHQLHQLHARSVQDSMTLPRAIASYLSKADQPQLPDKPAKASKLSVSSKIRRPVWRKNDSEQPGDFYTIRTVKGKRQVIKKRTVGWGYWSDIRNVRLELQSWMHANLAKDSKKLPSQRQMRQTGDNSLAYAIHKHGGYAEVFPEHEAAARQKEKVTKRKCKSHWDDFEVLRQELLPFLRPVTEPPNSFLYPNATPTATHKATDSLTVTHSATDLPSATNNAANSATHSAMDSYSATNSAIHKATDSHTAARSATDSYSATDSATRSAANSHSAHSATNWHSATGSHSATHLQKATDSHIARGSQQPAQPINGQVNGQVTMHGNNHINEHINANPSGQANRLINGQANVHLNGHISGQANGQINGANGQIIELTNGHINGQAHGRVDGHVDWQANGQIKGYATGRVNGWTGGQTRLRMCTQKELMKSGRMDILSAVRMWGGHTAVAKRMNVLPNTRHNRTLDDLKREVMEVIEEQGWQTDAMPKYTQLQAIGRHGLCAAISDMGGIRIIATKIGLDKGRKETRGRAKKTPHVTRARARRAKKNIADQQAEKKKSAERRAQSALEFQRQIKSQQQKSTTPQMKTNRSSTAGMGVDSSAAADLGFEGFKLGSHAAKEAKGQGQQAQVAVEELELV